MQSGLQCTSGCIGHPRTQSRCRRRCRMCRSCPHQKWCSAHDARQCQQHSWWFSNNPYQGLVVLCRPWTGPCISWHSGLHTPLSQGGITTGRLGCCAMHFCAPVNSLTHRAHAVAACSQASSALQDALACAMLRSMARPFRILLTSRWSHLGVSEMVSPLIRAAEGFVVAVVYYTT
jgi:hypothetical protein